MKFGKRLASEAARRWSDSYFDYKAIKKAIKDDIDNKGKPCLHGPVVSYSAWPRAVYGGGGGAMSTCAGV